MNEVTVKYSESKKSRQDNKGETKCRPETTQIVKILCISERSGFSIFHIRAEIWTLRVCSDGVESASKICTVHADFINVAMDFARVSKCGLAPFQLCELCREFSNQMNGLRNEIKF